MNNKTNIAVNIHGDPDLSRMIQELAFSKNYRWIDGKSLFKGKIRYIIFDTLNRSISYICGYDMDIGIKYNLSIILDGYTDIKTLLSLLKDENNEIIIDGITVKYKKGEATVRVGALFISTAIFKQLTDCMSITDIGNYRVVEVILNDGTRLSKSLINKVNDFVNKINQK